MDMIAGNSLDVYEEKLLVGFMEMWSEEEYVESLMPLPLKTVKVNDGAVVDDFLSLLKYYFSLWYI